ncbi:hypothetical protein BMT54_09965 [Pasteurellaceae bacterium 15-036681]|nr:hypothetical protein BMT54_09965 [Pasteurellaceae bacterium 15-036681]
MEYFFDLANKCFLVEGIHVIPVDAIAVSETEYSHLINGRAKGREIIMMGRSLTLTPIRPSLLHEWNGTEWRLSAEKRTKLISQRKESIIHKISEKTDQLKEQILVGYPQAEIDSFYRQEKEALAYKADNNADTPMLLSISKARGVSLVELVDKVLEKAEKFAAIMGDIIGQRQKFEDSTLSAETIEQLDTIEQEVEQWQLSI